MYTAETNSPTRSHKSPRKTNSPTHSHKSPIKEPRESYLGPTLVVHANLEKKNIQAENYEKSLENTLLLMLEIGRLGRIIEE